MFGIKPTLWIYHQKHRTLTSGSLKDAGHSFGDFPGGFPINMTSVVGIPSGFRDYKLEK